MSTSWLLEEDILIFILLMALTWFGAIIYFIPLQLYLDQKAATAAQRPAAQRSGDPKLTFIAETYTGEHDVSGSSTTYEPNSGLHY